MLLEFKFENVLDLLATLPPLFLFVSNRDNNTISIFDISNPLSPVLVEVFGNAEELNGPTELAITGNTLYVSNQFDNTISIYDIFVPPTPMQFVKKFGGAGELTGSAGLAITGNTLYIANQLANTVSIFDVFTPPVPVRIGEFGADVLHAPTGLAIFLPPAPV
ncbi:LVIVD repeat-containing protein [Bacillus sp. 71mf]|nr:LVIVD repeat-containing protein [Bacillus sp. 71mf]SFS38444.1 LVIVD repeat-containing protein [Bacillus sp. 103mf]